MHVFQRVKKRPLTLIFTPFFSLVPSVRAGMEVRFPVLTGEVSSGLGACVFPTLDFSDTTGADPVDTRGGLLGVVSVIDSGSIEKRTLPMDFRPALPPGMFTNVKSSVSHERVLSVGDGNEPERDEDDVEFLGRGTVRLRRKLGLRGRAVVGFEDCEDSRLKGEIIGDGTEGSDDVDEVEPDVAVFVTVEEEYDLSEERAGGGRCGGR